MSDNALAVSSGDENLDVREHAVRDVRPKRISVPGLRLDADSQRRVMPRLASFGRHLPGK